MRFRGPRLFRRLPPVRPLRPPHPPRRVVVVRRPGCRVFGLLMLGVAVALGLRLLRK